MKTQTLTLGLAAVMLAAGGCDNKAADNRTNAQTPEAQKAAGTKTVAAGQSIPNFTLAILNDMNAKHAKDFAGCTKAETLALHQTGAAAAAAIVRGFSDAELDASGTVMAGMPPMTTQQVVESILINHINDHMGSIRKTVGG